MCDRKMILDANGELDAFYSYKESTQDHLSSRTAGNTLGSLECVRNGTFAVLICIWEWTYIQETSLSAYFVSLLKLDLCLS